MKNYLLLLLVLTSIFSCKNFSNSNNTEIKINLIEQSDGEQIIQVNSKNNDKVSWYIKYKPPYSNDSTVIVEKPSEYRSEILSENKISISTDAYEHMEIHNAKLFAVVERNKKALTSNEITVQYVFGSCPYLFVSKDNQFISYGSVLSFMDNENKESVERIKIDEFDGRIEIRELEDEVSFINYVRLIIKSKDNTEKIIMPENTLLKEGDDLYYIIKKNEKIVIDFENNFSETDEIYFEIKGYYLLNKSI